VANVATLVPATVLIPDIFTLMQYQRFGTRYQVRLETGEPLVESLTPWLVARGIEYASVTGLGAVQHATFSWFNWEQKVYETHPFDEQMELVSLVGNVTIREDAPFLHAHVSLGRRDLSLMGGHVNELVARPLLEIWLAQEEDTVKRVLDESCGLYVMDLPEHA
jgi:predicted DNA-binding protein with PD1-like motif